MIIATAPSFAVIDMLLWHLLTLAIYALPFYARLSTAMWAYGYNAGFIGASLVGLVAAGLTFGIGQTLFATLRSPWLRGLVAALYAAPAAARYSDIYGSPGSLARARSGASCSPRLARSSSPSSPGRE